MTTLPTVIIDTREPDPPPWTFPGCEIIRRKLDTGDYGLDGFTDPPEGIVVERKAPGDLVACMTSSRERFVRELERLAEYKVAFVVVEATLPEILLPERWGKSHPSSRLGSLLAWMVRYPSVQWVFSGSQDVAARIALRIFERYMVERQEQYAVALLDNGAGTPRMEALIQRSLTIETTTSMAAADGRCGDARHHASTETLDKSSARPYAPRIAGVPVAERNETR